MTDSTVFILIVVSICIMVVIALSIIVLFTTSQRRIMTEMKKNHESQLKMQKMLLENTVTVQEKERSRIARELHDNIGSQLSVMNLSLNVLKSMSQFEDKEKEVINQISSSLSSSIETTRSISHELFPATISKFGINTALRALATKINKSGGLNLSLNINHEWEDLDKENGIHIFRVLQELINNTIKHAQAKEAKIRSWQEDQSLRLVYQDDGVGLPANHQNKTGIGLGNMQTRIGLLNGVLVMSNRKEGGLEASITLPIEPTLNHNYV